jgi:hypothetical protein
VKPGQAVTWQIGSETHPITLTGRVISANGSTATVEANGAWYQVEWAKLRPIGVPVAQRLCRRPGCDNPVINRASVYCSLYCFSRMAEYKTEEIILAQIIRHKTDHDGVAPTVDFMSVETGISRKAIRLALMRLCDAGKIRYADNGSHRNIIVTGGRWIYQEVQSSP